MKIYKPTFDDFLEEVQEPVYLQELAEGPLTNPVRKVYIVASGYNKEDHPLQYRTFIGEVFHNAQEVQEKANTVIRDMRRQIVDRNLNYYPGILSEKPITCNPYEISQKHEALDISSLAKQDPDGNEIQEPNTQTP